MNKKALLISVVDINDRRYKSGFIDISNTYYEITLERAGVYCQSLKKRLKTPMKILSKPLKLNMNRMMIM